MVDALPFIRRIAVVGLCAAIAWALWPRGGALPPLDGATGLVLDGVAARVAQRAPSHGVVLLGEDHRSAVPDQVAARLLEQGGYDCLFLELDEALQPAIDQYGAGGNWTRTVRPALIQRFRTNTPAMGQDRKALRAARHLGVQLLAVDRLPAEVVQTVQRASGQEPDEALKRLLIDQRDLAMGERIAAHFDAGRCHRALFTVGWNHLPGLARELERRGIPSWAAALDHREPPPLPARLQAVWEEGLVTFR